MAVDSNTYGTVERVMDRLGDLFPDGNASTIDRLNVDQVERQLDDIASEMNALLQAYGYTAPIALADDEFAYEHARSANVAGACAQILISMPGIAFDPDNPDEMAGNRRAGFQAQYNRWMKMVRDREIPASQATGLIDRFKVGSATDRKTGKEKKPAFSRSMFDYPGSVVRTAEDDD